MDNPILMERAGSQGVGLSGAALDEVLVPQLAA